MEESFLHTERLILRIVNAELYSEVLASYTDEALMDFFGYTNLEHLENEKERYRKGTVTFNRSFLNFYLILKNTNQVIGACGFHTWYIHHHRAELGYGIYLDEHKQHGYMKEALSRIIQYGFETMQLNRIEALVALDNLASIKLLAGQQFVYEGVLKEHYYINNQHEDSALYALLKRDYTSS